MRRGLALLTVGALVLTPFGRGIVAWTAALGASAWSREETPTSFAWPSLRLPQRAEPASPVPASPPLLTRSPPPPGAAEGSPGGAARGDRFAVVIGIDEYPGDHDLTAAVNDAREVRRALTRAGFPRDNILVLLNGQASRERILAGAAWLAEVTGRDAIGVLFYAGHVRHVGGDPDGDGEHLDEGFTAADQLPVYDGELVSALGPARGRLWIAVAGCYAAGFSDLEDPGRVLHYASREDELAYESVQLEHSFLVEYLVRQGMLEEGLTSPEDAFAHAVASMEGSHAKYRPLQSDGTPGNLRLARVSEGK